MPTEDPNRVRMNSNLDVEHIAIDLTLEHIKMLMDRHGLTIAQVVGVFDASIFACRAAGVEEHYRSKR